MTGVFEEGERSASLQRKKEDITVTAAYDPAKFYDLKKQVLETSLTMSRSGMAPSTWGNVSARDPVTGLVAITPSGIPYDQLTPEDMCVVDVHENQVDCPWKPSTETPMHCVFYRAKPWCHAIVHTHSLYATAFASLGWEIPVVVATLASTVGGSVPCAPYATPGDAHFGEVALQAMGERTAVLLGNHGVVALGKDLDDAYTVAETVENAAKIYHFAKAVGEPKILPDEDVAALRDKYLRKYGQK